MKIKGIKGEFLSTEEILLLHDKIIQESKVKDDYGYIDNTGALFEGAVNSIFAGFGGYEAYPTIEEKACRLCFNIISCHCFKNANKRTGLMAMILTYKMNGMTLKLSQNELFEIINTIGEHADDEIYQSFCEKIISNSMSHHK